MAGATTVLKLESLLLLGRVAAMVKMEELPWSRRSCLGAGLSLKAFVGGKSAHTGWIVDTNVSLSMYVL